MLRGNCSKRHSAFRLQSFCIPSGFNTSVPSTYDKIIYFYAYILLSLFYLLIYFTVWDALKKCKVLKIRIKHFYLEVWSIIALFTKKYSEVSNRGSFEAQTMSSGWGKFPSLTSGKNLTLLCAKPFAGVLLWQKDGVR